MNLLHCLALALPEGAREWLIVILLLIVVFYWIKTIIEIVNSRFSNESNKTLWLLIVILLPALGMLVYIYFGRNSRVGRNDELGGV